MLSLDVGGVTYWLGMGEAMVFHVLAALPLGWVNLKGAFILHHASHSILIGRTLLGLPFEFDTGPFTGLACCVAHLSRRAPGPRHPALRHRGQVLQSRRLPRSPQRVWKTCSFPCHGRPPDPLPARLPWLR